MAITIDLTQEEEARLQELAAVRGLPPEEHAHLLLTNLLKTASVPVSAQRSDQAERERLIAAVKAGDKGAWVQLLYMTPAGPSIDPADVS